MHPPREHELNDLYRVVVTGSRNWNDLGIITAALTRTQNTRLAQDMLLVHGACDPRDPIEGWIIPWEQALTHSRPDQMTYDSADWQAHLIATTLGWHTEPCPADWTRYGKSAGPRRNTIMLKLPAREGHAFFQAHLPNRGTLDCATKIHNKNIPLTCWCDACGPAPQPAPCPTHSLPTLLREWGKHTKTVST